MCTATGLIMVGGALEVGGFGLVVAQLVRVQRREFGTPQWIARTRTWVRRLARRLFRRRKSWTVAAGSAKLSAGGSMSAHGMVWRNMEADRPDRVDAIVHNLTELHDRVSRLAVKHGDKIGSLRRDVDATRRELYEHAAEQDAQRKAELRASITWETWGVLLFLAGTVCSVAGSLAA